MPGKTPHSNGNKPAEHGRRKSKDSKESSKSKGKKTVKDGAADDEMTVVVPPSKASKQPGAPPVVPDSEGDVSMGDDETTEGDAKVDPAVQAVAGT
jgi:26S proteasome regulatory subunit N3